jgi:hypothetical protein
LIVDPEILGIDDSIGIFHAIGRLIEAGHPRMHDYQIDQSGNLAIESIDPLISRSTINPQSAISTSAMERLSRGF